MAMQSPPVWKKRLAELHYQSHQALRTEDFTFGKHLQVYYYSRPISLSYTADTGNVSSEVEKYLKNEITSACQTAKEDYTDFSSEVEGLKKDPIRDGNAWKAKLEALRKHTIAKATENINGCFTNAEAKIGTLPPSQRDAAADVFSHAWTAFSNFLDQVFSWMRKLVDAVWDFIKGIWDKIKEGFEAIKSGFNAAAGFIENIVGHFVSSTAYAFWSAGPVSEPARPENTEAQSEWRREIDRTRAKVGEILRDLEHKIDTLGNDTAGINKTSTGVTAGVSW